jgi:hypothetical protein
MCLHPAADDESLWSRGGGGQVEDMEDIGELEHYVEMSVAVVIFLSRGCVPPRAKHEGGSHMT